MINLITITLAFKCPAGASADANNYYMSNVTTILIPNTLNQKFHEKVFVDR